MSETIDPGAEKFSEENHPGEGGDRLQNEGAPAINKLRDGLRNKFADNPSGFCSNQFFGGVFHLPPAGGAEARAMGGDCIPPCEGLAEFDR
jgi:hypothetical protein